MRTLGYVLVGWILFGFALSGLYSGGAGAPGGMAAGVAAAGALVWLVRSYRRGPSAGLVADLQAQLDRLVERLPPDPLSSAAIVGAWSMHTGDSEATARLHDEYRAVRSTVDEVQRELDAVRESGALRRRERLEAKLAQVHDYLRSIDALAAAAPELLDDAIAEHAAAAAAVDAARRSGADLQQLVAADDRLQGAREALRRDRERPLDAIRLADEAEGIARVAARRATVPSELAAVRERLDAVEDGLAGALSRHAASALAEVRGLPALAREHLERAEKDDPVALAAARATVERIESHVAELERAAATARPTLEAAEQALDAAVARGGAAAASRAAELTTAARELLRDERPDWLEISALADRALLLLGEERPGDATVVAPSGERARSARDEVWSWALTSGPHASEARAVAERIDRLLASAARLERDGDAAGAAALQLRVVSLAAPVIEAVSQPPVERAS